jgi:hypothetical protein
LIRNERYKLIWGFPGWTDGYGEDIKFLFQIPYYQDLLSSLQKRKKRGGPYPFTNDEMGMMVQLANKLRLTDENIANGTGYQLLYDLWGE